MTDVVGEVPSRSATADCRVFSTADPLRAHDYICSTYTQAGMRLVGDQTGLRMRDTQHDLGSFVLSDFAYTAGVQLMAEPLGRLMVARVLSGQWQCDTIGEQRLAKPGDVLLVAQPDRPYLSFWNSPVRLQLIAFDPSVLLDIAAARGDLVPRFTTLTPASAGSKQLVTTVMDHLLTDVVANPAARASSLALRSATRTLAAALLDAFPSNAIRDPIVSDRTDAVRSRVLRAAVAYVHDHAHEDITTGDLAAAAGVSRQAVHLAFRQHLGSTPRRYLERLRLDRAHRDLTDLDPRSTTVDQVALLWGFTRLERFRRDYGHTYGTSPEQTLRA